GAGPLGRAGLDQVMVRLDRPVDALGARQRAAELGGGEVARGRRERVPRLGEDRADDRRDREAAVRSEVDEEALEQERQRLGGGRADAMRAGPTSRPPARRWMRAAASPSRRRWASSTSRRARRRSARATSGSRMAAAPEAPPGPAAAVPSPPSAAAAARTRSS